jgi:hypothetical protein
MKALRSVASYPPIGGLSALPHRRSRHLPVLRFGGRSILNLNFHLWIDGSIDEGREASGRAEDEP